MSTNLTTTIQASKPALQTPAQATLVSRLTNALDPTDGRDRSSISSLLAPTDTERRMLQDRRSELRRGLSAPKGRAASLSLAERILSMFHAWPTVRLDEDKALGVAETYAAQLDHLPAWAVAAGILEMQGRKMPFPPSAGELRAACEAKASPAKDEVIAIGRILDAEIYTKTKHGEDAVKRVKALAETLCAGMRQDDRPNQPETVHAWIASRREREAARMEAADIVLPPLSQAARSTLGHVHRQTTEAAE